MISYFVSCSITLINRSLHRSRFLMQRKKYLNFIANRSFSARTGWRWNFFLPDWSALKMGGLRWNSNIFFFALNFFFQRTGWRWKYAVCDQNERFAIKLCGLLQNNRFAIKLEVCYENERYAIKVSGTLSKWAVCYQSEWYAIKQPVCYKIWGMLWKWGVRYKSEQYAIKVSGMLSKWAVWYCKGLATKSRGSLCILRQYS